MDLSANTQTGREYQRHHDGRMDDIQDLENLYRDMQKEISHLMTSYALRFEEIQAECKIENLDIDAAIEELHDVIQTTKDNINAELDDEYGVEE